MANIVKNILFAAILAFIVSCGSTSKTPEANTAESVFNKGLAAFKDEEWLEAQNLFDVINLQYPASQFADDAQYYIAECGYKRKEYVMAAFNFNRLYRTYPRSEYAKSSLYKAALCYFELSPDCDRDQEYTTKAIAAFSTFQAFYPMDSLSKEASSKIVDLRNKLAERSFNTAVLYKKIYSPNSSIIYYDEVINNFPDSKFCESAFIGKIETLIQMKKTSDAKSIIEVYKKTYPSGSKIDYVKNLEVNLPK
jgi:outer membrane protein assembly factor BamD